MEKMFRLESKGMLLGHIVLDPSLVQELDFRGFARFATRPPIRFEDYVTKAPEPIAYDHIILHYESQVKKDVILLNGPIEVLESIRGIKFLPSYTLMRSLLSSPGAKIPPTG